MSKEELDIQKEIENYFTESTGFGRDKIKNFMDIVNKALRQKGERIEELEQKLEQTEKDLADYQFNYPKIKELEKENTELKEQNRSYEQLIDNGSVTLAKERLKNYKQLTKARGVLRNVIDYLGQFCSDYPDCVIEAEKILNEE